jgi:dTDP-4-amino-4,6-dideoxygalactose transaminase
LAGRELSYVREAVENGRIAGDGAFTKRCQSLLEEALGVERALLTPSCTHALEMAALLLNIQPADEIIVPSFTFVSTVNAFVLRGARPVFIDIRPDTLNLDEEQLEGLITSRTKAIVPVHYAGVACEMDRICEIAAAHGIPVVEDNAQGLFGKYKGRYLGTFGALATQSFHETKNITCGEGGALLINDETLTERAEIIREKGTDRARFFRGQVDKYTWRDLGSSYLLSDILAAVLLAQLEQRDGIQAARRRIWERYASSLSDWADANGVGLPQVPPHCEQTYHLFYLLLPSLEERSRFIETLKDAGIQAVFHYQPLHLSPMGRAWGYSEGDLPATERVADRLVRLPLYSTLGDDELMHTLATIRSFKVRR